MSLYWPELEHRQYCDDCDRLIFFQYGDYPPSTDERPITITKPITNKKVVKCLGCHLGLGYGLAYGFELVPKDD